jgi:hypothetical protein
MAVWTALEKRKSGTKWPDPTKHLSLPSCPAGLTVSHTLGFCVKVLRVLWQRVRGNVPESSRNNWDIMNFLA